MGVPLHAGPAPRGTVANARRSVVDSSWSLGNRSGRNRYQVEPGRRLRPFPETTRIKANRLNRCQSGVRVEPEPFLPVVDLSGRHGPALLPFRVLQRAIAEVGPGRARQRPAVVSVGQVVRA